MFQKSFPADELEEIEDAFFIEIANGEISMSAVVEKVARNPDLEQSGLRRIYDKVRQLCQRKKDVETLALPTETESLDVRVGRMMSSNTNVPVSEQASQESDEEFLPTASSSKVKDLFGPKELKLLWEGFRSIISRKSIKDEYIQAAIKSNNAAKKLSEMMNMSTIKNRLKYEIRKARAKKH